MKRYLKKWNTIRLLQLGIAVFIIAQGIYSGDIPILIMGAAFSLMPVLNIGCCRTSGCNNAGLKSNEKDGNTKDISYEEVH